MQETKTEGMRTVPRARPSFETIYMELARSLAERSTCARLQVGCVIASIDYRHVYGVGYNGNAKHFPNKCDSDEPGNCGCLHAEDNAVINCQIPYGAAADMFVTHAPCVMCAKRIVNLGNIGKVLFQNVYRSEVGLQILKDADILVVQFSPSLEWSKK